MCILNGMTESYSEANRQFVPQELPQYPPLDAEQTPEVVPTLIDLESINTVNSTDIPKVDAGRRRLVFTNSNNVISVRVEK